MSSITPDLSAVTALLADNYAPIARKSTWYCDDEFCNGMPHQGWEHKHCRGNQRPPTGDWFIWLLLSGRGFGKLLSLDTPIPTPTGWTTMGSIAVGDTVFDEDGNQCTVTAVFNKEVPERAYRVQFSDHTEITAGGEHQWVTWDHGARKAYGRSGGEPGTIPKSWPTWESPRGAGPKVRTTDEIVETFWQPGRRDRNHSIPLAGPLQTGPVDLLVDPYVLGAWLGDGDTRGSGFTGIDPEIWERIEDAGFTVKHYTNGKRHNIEKLTPLLRQLGVIHNKHVPAQYLRSSASQRLALLQGLMDTDGTISKFGYAEFMSTKECLATAVLEIARSLGEKPVLTEGRATLYGKDCGPKYRVTWRPSSVVPVWLQRKRDRVRPSGSQASRNVHRMITGVEPVIPVPMRCISVDSPNHMYLAGEGMIPTHNSRCAAEWILKEASEHPNTEWGVLGPTSEAVRKCGDDLTAGIYAIAPPGLITKYNRTLGDFYLKNGAIIHLISADKPDRLRGFNLAGAWADEISSWRYPDTWYLGLLPTLRDRRTTPHIVVTSTPKPVTLLRSLVDEEFKEQGTTVITRGSTFDNAENLAPQFLSEMRARYEGTRRGRQELYGELLTDVEGALVTQDMIDRPRIHGMPSIHLSRVVVAVDPATTSGEDSDETGIVVCAKGIDGRGYILADLSCKESPDGWARIVAAAYDRYGADRVVAEKNQGGDMVEQTIRSVHPNIAYKGVNAKVGKKLRAEPIAALYEQGKVSHIDYFEELEDQWTTWVPDLGPRQKSPDRVDALVHGLTELGLIGLPGVHIKEWMESEHPPCQACSMPSPKGTTQCPHCGAAMIVTEAPEPIPVEAFSMTSGMQQPQARPPDQRSQMVMDMLSNLNQRTQWWKR